MSDLIFLVHGMGEFASGWEKSVVDQLRSFCDTYSQPGKGDFNKRFNCIAVNYSQLFLDILKEWAKEKKDLDAVTGLVGASLVQKLMSWIADDGSIEKNFFWSHIFDVITYRLLPTVRDAVQVRVALQLFDGIKDLDVDDNWSIIAHSLGTAVTHDTLQTWYQQPLAGGGKLGDQRVPFVVQMVANVSRLLQSQYNVFESDVRPGGACDLYSTAHHPLDPFTILKPFLPTAWPEPRNRDKYYLAKLEPDYIQQANIHDFAHYLRHPDVVVPLFRSLRFPTYVTKDAATQYRAKFKLHGTLTDSELIDLRNKLEDAGVGLPDTWDAILTVWNRVKDLMQLAQGGANGN